jgi:SAM-dependent methyltransferase
MGGSGEPQAEELRFEFGKNWARFLRTVDERQIAEAERSLTESLGVKDLQGRRFLDIGSGSGLFSLAARKLGAVVHSFDFDAESVNCTAELRRRYFRDDTAWTIERQSVLDSRYMRSLGLFDIVYSWGVLHHTGAMWDAIGNASEAVASGGNFLIAIYNDQGRSSRMWARVKKTYNASPYARPLITSVAFVRLWGPTTVRDLMSLRPFATWRSYANDRGMSPWTDVIDWVGGYPFEVARPEQIFDFCQSRGLVLQRMKTCAGGLGCNEFVFERRGKTPS